MTRLSKSAAAFALAGAFVLGATSLGFGQQASFQLAQNYGAPPEDVGGGNGNGYAPPGGGYAPPGGGSDASSVVVRVSRLEDQIRELTGQLQQMRYANQQLQNQLKKFQQDVDFRFQESHGGHPYHHSELTPPAGPAPQAADSGVDANAASAAAPDTADSADSSVADDAAGKHSGRHDDAYDPAQDPTAPGAPKPLGSHEVLPPAVADNDGANSDPNAPLNLPSAQYSSAPHADNPAPRATHNVPAGGATTPSGTMTASVETDSPRQEYEVALGYFRQKDYDNAQRGFSAFLDKNPHSRMTADAIYLLGESYAARGHTREAAEQFLKISTSYASSSRAPQAMLRLGQSLKTLGAKEQACATFSEVSRKYPNASTAIKAGAEREAKRAQCGA